MSFVGDHLADWDVIVDCARKWAMVEIYYRKSRKYDQDVRRYELLIVSERGDKLYAYDVKAEKTKAFKKGGILRVIEMPVPPSMTKTEFEDHIGYAVELGAECLPVPEGLLVPAPPKEKRKSKKKK